jgi:hypothetical protein
MYYYATSSVLQAMFDSCIPKKDLAKPHSTKCSQSGFLYIVLNNDTILRRTVLDAAIQLIAQVTIHFPKEL